MNDRVKTLERVMRDLMAAYEACNGCDHPAYEAAERALAANQPAPDCHQQDLVTAEAAQEPVAWLHRWPDGNPAGIYEFNGHAPPGVVVTPLYAAPQPLTVQDAARVLLISSDRGVCVGGRWDGWLMIRHPDGHWVSHHKLDAVDPRTEMTDALRAIADACTDRAYYLDDAIRKRGEG